MTPQCRLTPGGIARERVVDDVPHGIRLVPGLLGEPQAVTCVQPIEVGQDCPLPVPADLRNRNPIGRIWITHSQVLEFVTLRRLFIPGLNEKAEALKGLDYGFHEIVTLPG